MRGMRSVGLAAVVMVGCSGEPGEDSAMSEGQADPATQSRAALEWMAPLPDLEPLALDGSPAGEVPERGRWSAVALCPGACSECEERLPEWDTRARIWGELGLPFVVVSERPPSLLAESASREGLEVPLYATSTSIFRLTGSLDQPTLVLLDPEGVVRFVGRKRGTADERLVSIRRQFQMLSGPVARCQELAREVLPGASRVEIRSTVDTDWLGESACVLGLSPWYGVAWDEGGRWLGVALPMERDTGCDQCQPLYLMVGVTRDGRIQAIEPIEPVVSLGERIETEPFFNRLKGRRSAEGVAKVPIILDSERADMVTRELLTVVFYLAGRMPEGMKPEVGP